MQNLAERRNVRRNDYNPGYYGGYNAYEYDNYDYSYYNNYNGYDAYSGDYNDYGYYNDYGRRPIEPKRKPAAKKTGKPAGKNTVKKSGAKQQPHRKKAPVKNGYHNSGYPQKRRAHGAGMDYNYSRYPEEEIRYRRREPADDFYNSSMSYAGRGQMSYDDFVRNREFFGGEDEVYTVHHQRRRTGGTVKNKPQQGRSKKTEEKNNKKNIQKSTPDQGRSSSFGTKKKTVNKGNPPEEKTKNQKRSKEIMDERARRKKIRRHAGRASKTMTPRKRKIKRFFTAFSIFLVIAVISVMLSLTVFFKTEKIIVTGETRYSQEDIINLSGIETGENIFLCDKAAASKKIVDALPFVAQANIGFVIPNAITIEIVEDVPSYAIGYSDGYYIIGENGRILEKTAENYDNLPIVQGTEITTNVIGEYADFTDENITSILNELVRVLDAYNFENVTVIDISNTANIMFVYDDRITVVIGLPEDISYKIKTAQTIINEKLDPNNTGLIKGRLDVSMCKGTKKSYFNENEVYIPQIQQPVTSPTEETAVSEETQETQEATQEETLEAAAEETFEAEATEDIQETTQAEPTEAAVPENDAETSEAETDAPA